MKKRYTLKKLLDFFTPHRISFLMLKTEHIKLKNPTKVGSTNSKDTSDKKNRKFIILIPNTLSKKKEKLRTN